MVAGVHPPSIEHVNVNESRRTSSEFTAAVLKTQPAPVCLRSVPALAKETNVNKCLYAHERPNHRAGVFSVLHST